MGSGNRRVERWLGPELVQPPGRRAHAGRPASPEVFKVQSSDELPGAPRGHPRQAQGDRAPARRPAPQLAGLRPASSPRTPSASGQSRHVRDAGNRLPRTRCAPSP
ncbi:hypothetical protein QJS66_04045 [Kocuria rhizophila]|nr:hypothetical protein QJS66_04045 [Kocuria rhizophila]